MAEETKGPEPGQYWEHVASKDRAYFIGRLPDGPMVFQCEGDDIEFGDLDWSDWQHIPGCTGWEWEPEKHEETWPKYYVGQNWSDEDAYIRYDSAESNGVFVDCFGDEKVHDGHEFKTVRNSFVEHRWTELTEAEAFARVTKRKPAESPDDWVVQDRVPARHGIDSGWWGDNPPRDVDHWWTVESGDTEAGKMNGHKSLENGVLSLRCRRKDLPKPAPEAETYPKWYVYGDKLHVVKRINSHDCVCTRPDGKKWITAWLTSNDIQLSDGEFVEITEQEAMAILCKPKHVPIRLWVTYRLHDEGGSWPVRATPAHETCENWKEIQFDSDGMFIEVEGG